MRPVTSGEEYGVAQYTVTKVRKEDADGHRHLEGVITNNGTHYTTQQVYDSIEAGDSWKTQVAGTTAIIKQGAACGYEGCSAAPYVTTNPDGTKYDNLENLPEG